jgi:hypothetical protein
LNVGGTTTIIDSVINNTSFNSLSVSVPSIHYSNITLVSPLNVSGPTALLTSLNVSGLTTLSNNLNVVGKSFFSGNTSGNNPIIYVSQNRVWDDQKYALYVNGYTFLNGLK